MSESIIKLESLEDAAKIFVEEKLTWIRCRGWLPLMFFADDDVQLEHVVRRMLKEMSDGANVVYRRV